MLNPAQLADIKDRDPYLYETLTQIVAAVNGIGTQAGASAVPLAAPPNIASLSVTGQNGWFSIAIMDPAGTAQPNLGLHYFIEYDTNPAFPNPQQLPEQASRNAIVYLGNLTLYWRVYSSFRTSAISKKVNFGGATPTAVSGGGATTPTIPPSQGGGAAGGGGGFGGGNRISGGPARTNTF